MNAISKITLPQTAFQIGITFLIRQQSDLTTRQLGVLMQCAEGMQTARGMAAYFGISKPAITRAIDKLDDLGLVRRAIDKKDRRSVNISITAKGVIFLRKLHREMED